MRTKAGTSEPRKRQVARRVATVKVGARSVSGRAKGDVPVSRFLQRYGGGAQAEGVGKSKPTAAANTHAAAVDLMLARVEVSASMLRDQLRPQVELRDLVDGVASGKWTMKAMVREIHRRSNTPDAVAAAKAGRDRDEAVRKELGERVKALAPLVAAGRVGTWEAVVASTSTRSTCRLIRKAVRR